MCIIITKIHSAKPLPEEVFENVWDNNPDGAGILYHNGKEAKLIKGIMNKKEFLEATKKVNKKGYAYIMHTRIATHGSVKPENTHPFVSKLVGFAHNGMFNVTPLPDKTDSESFFLWAIGNHSYKWCEDNKFLLDMATDGSRCAIMDLKTGEIMHLCEEDWKLDKKYNGYKFSNQTYEYKRSLMTTYGGTGTSAGKYNYETNRYTGYDWDDWDDYTNDWYGATKKDKEEDEPKIIDEITSQMYAKTPSGELRIRTEWAKAFLDQFCEKTDEEKAGMKIRDVLRKLREEIKQTIKYDGVNSYEYLAQTAIRSFYQVAYMNHYWYSKQVQDAMVGLVETADDGQEETLLKKEIESQLLEWS